MAKKRNTNRRPQTPKSGNKAMMAAFQDLRRSSATSPVPSGTMYSRKPKHIHRAYEEN